MKSFIEWVKRLPKLHKNLFLGWLTSMLIYSCWAIVSESAINFLVYTTVTNLVLLPLIWIQGKEKEMAKRIESPLEYFQLTQSHVVLGDDSFLIHKVKRVAIDVQGDTGYCSLPFNHVKPGIFPNFTFSANDYDALNAHIQKVLPSVIIIT